MTVDKYHAPPNSIAIHYNENRACGSCMFIGRKTCGAAFPCLSSNRRDDTNVIFVPSPVFDAVMKATRKMTAPVEVSSDNADT